MFFSVLYSIKSFLWTSYVPDPRVYLPAFGFCTHTVDAPMERRFHFTSFFLYYVWMHLVWLTGCHDVECFLFCRISDGSALFSPEFQEDSSSFLPWLHPYALYSVNYKWKFSLKGNPPEVLVTSKKNLKKNSRQVKYLTQELIFTLWRCMFLKSNNIALNLNHFLPHVL